MRARVSIPNGMEFYGVSARHRKAAWLVSIPNGMEFYPRRLLFSATVVRSFNSQRDGILPSLFVVKAVLLGSFNSQRDGILPYSSHDLEGYKVSFNSQRDGILLGLVDEVRPVKNSFNSQRDGILQSITSKRLLTDVVSIPNGMEFYGGSLGFGTEALKFQFPTGWNSTQLYAYTHCL